EADGRIESCNDAVERTLGFALEELRGSLVTELCSDPAEARRAAIMRREVLSTGTSERELKLRRKDGSSLATTVSALVLADDQGRPVGMVFRIHDLTERRRGAAERKRLRAKLLHSERLSALGEMAARIAHEVRNPLVSIGAATQVVAEELGPESPVTGE